MESDDAFQSSYSQIVKFVARSIGEMESMDMREKELPVLWKKKDTSIRTTIIMTNEDKNYNQRTITAIVRIIVSMILGGRRRKEKQKKKK